MGKEDTIFRIKKRYQEFANLDQKEFEIAVIDRIWGTPYTQAEPYMIKVICGKDYFPGFFLLSERKNLPPFLLDEMAECYEEWVKGKIRAELKSSYKDEFLLGRILEYGEENIANDAYQIINFETRCGKKFDEVVSSQLYGDLFRRINRFLLTGNPLYEDCTYVVFNQIGKQVAIELLARTETYSLHERLIQSVLGGLIGMDWKEKIGSTIVSSLDSVIRLDVDESIEEKCNRVFEITHTYVQTHNRMKIDYYKEYYEEIISGGKKTVCWMTDDYIQTVLEMKFIEEQMKENLQLTVYLMPRYGSYSNDASYKDIVNLLDEDIFQVLQNFRKEKRLIICRDGMDIGCFDGWRMSREMAKAIYESDVLVISGARGLEMAQGISKTVYFTGIAVCKSYTESVTGLDRHKGDLIFVRQGRGKRLFHDFKARGYRRLPDSDTGREIACAGTTMMEILNEKVY